MLHILTIAVRQITHAFFALAFKNSQMLIIRVPRKPFRFFDKLKYEIRNKVLIFVSKLKLRHKTKLNDFSIFKITEY